MSSIVAVVGARPNFMKIAPVMHRLRGAGITVSLVHTGQHYDASMKDSFFHELRIPEPDVNLEVGSGTHAAQTGEIMIRFEPVLDRLAPTGVLVVGDVNSTIACALVAANKRIPVIHVEAGLRSFDRTMPEESAGDARPAEAGEVPGRGHKVRRADAPGQHRKADGVEG